MANVLDAAQMEAFERQLPYYRAQRDRARVQIERWEELTGMPIAEYFALPLDDRLAVAKGAAKKAKRITR